LPIAVGFGVKNAENAAEIARNADGVVVGTALVEALKSSLDAKGQASPSSVGAVTGLVASISQGVRGARPKGGVMSWLTRLVS
ncbi:MAG: tryptophan synthase subunit alpha, partial [Methylocystis sp.]